MFETTVSDIASDDPPDEALGDSRRSMDALCPYHDTGSCRDAG